MVARSIFREAKTSLSFLLRNCSFAAPLSQPFQKPWLPDQNLRPETPSSSSKSVFSNGGFESRIGILDLNERKLAEDFSFALNDLSQVEARGSDDDLDDDDDCDDDSDEDYTTDDSDGDLAKRKFGGKDDSDDEE